MVAHKFNSIRQIINFNDSDNEPHTDYEKYILRAMWIMMMAEFEGAIKELVEEYLSKIKTLNIDAINPCILLTYFSGKEARKLFSENDIGLSSSDPIEILSKINELQEKYESNNSSKNLIKEINYKKFTQDNKPKYKYKQIKKLFNSLGIFFKNEDTQELLVLESIERTRDEIAHGNSVEITAYELRENLTHLENLFDLLERKLY